jgi:hypothetical protein
VPPAVRDANGNRHRPQAVSVSVKNGERHARPPMVAGTDIAFGRRPFRLTL